MAMDDVQVKDGVDAETVEAVKALSGTYKHGWNTEIEMEYAPKGLSEDIVRLICIPPFFLNIIADNFVMYSKSSSFLIKINENIHFLTFAHMIQCSF